MTGRRREHLGHILAGAAILAGAFGIGLIEALRLPRGLIWVVVATTIGLMVTARFLGNRR